MILAGAVTTGGLGHCADTEAILPYERQVINKKRTRRRLAIGIGKQVLRVNILRGQI